MSRVLLDTHAFLWFAFDDERLSARAAEVISDASVEKVLSIASLWEIAVKTSLGKLELGTSLERFLTDEVEGRELEVLGIEHAHLVRVADLPFHHRDPFDRLLIAQAVSEGLSIMSIDPRFEAYGVNVIWK